MLLNIFRAVGVGLIVGGITFMPGFQWPAVAIVAGFAIFVSIMSYLQWRIYQLHQEKIHTLHQAVVENYCHYLGHLDTFKHKEERLTEQEVAAIKDDIEKYQSRELRRGLTWDDQSWMMAVERRLKAAGVDPDDHEQVSRYDPRKDTKS